MPKNNIGPTHWGKCGDCGPNWDGDAIRVSTCNGCNKDYCHRCQDVHDCDDFHKDEES